jgi:cytochrome b561
MIALVLAYDGRRTPSSGPPSKMPISLNTHLITVVLVGALVAWRLYARIRRMVGRQRLTTVRPWITVVVFPLIAVLLLATRFAHPLIGAALVGGAAAGVGLGLIGTRLTKFEATPAGLFYTPNAHLGIALSLLFILRLAYRFIMPQMTGQPFDPQSMRMGASPLTMGLFGMLAGYYVTYAIGLLRWRAQVSGQPATER